MQRMVILCVSFSHAAMSDSLRPHVLQPSRLLCPWNSPGKNTGVDCHSLLWVIFLTRDQTPVSLTEGKLFTIWATNNQFGIISKVVFFFFLIKLTALFPFPKFLLAVPSQELKIEHSTVQGYISHILCKKSYIPSTKILLAAAAAKSLQSCPTVRPHRRQRIRLPIPGILLAKNDGVGSHFLLQCMKMKRESEVTQSYPTVTDPMDCSLPGSSVHGIFQARVLEWSAIFFNIV